MPSRVISTIGQTIRDHVKEALTRLNLRIMQVALMTRGELQGTLGKYEVLDFYNILAIHFML